MNIFKTLLTICLAGSVNIAKATVIASYSVTSVGSIYSTLAPYDNILTGAVQTVAPNSHIYATNNPNTATLDVTGTSATLTMLTNTKNFTNLGGTQYYANTIIMNGTWDGSIFTATNGSYALTSCQTSDPDSCFRSPPPPFLYSSISGSLRLTSGNFITSSITNPNLNIFRDEAFTLTAVPIPTTAWLFGSSLIGLAGVARRRIK